MQRLSRRRECLNLLKRITLLPERVPSYDEFPYDIPFVRDLDLAFGKAVTCFVGDNGSGKSTLIEAIAEACALPIWGGSRNETVLAGTAEG